MGDRYELIKDCAYCGTLHDDIWYAPTCGSFGFKCRSCGKQNFIISDLTFTVKKIEDVTYDDVEDAISSASNMMSEKQIEDEAKHVFKGLKKQVKKSG